MKELASWLAEIEQKAADFYKGAARVFTENSALSTFLRQLAEDEAGHCRIMREASLFFTATAEDRTPIILDGKTRQRIEVPMNECLRLLAMGELNQASLFDCIPQTEFSEWNDFFLYTANAMASRNREYIATVASIERHKRVIEHYFTTMPGGAVYREGIKHLQPVWREKILVVDDFEPLTLLLQSILRDEGQVETAENGAEALSKMKDHYFVLIISDVDMPIMDGLDFYKESSSLFSGISDRFLFLTGDADQHRSAFFADHNLCFMEKPAPIKKIQENVHAMINLAVAKRARFCHRE
jgi:CheY-like chemotaxis protein